MNKEKLNEKLAELCGLELKHIAGCAWVWVNSDGFLCFESDEWDPTQDPSQLKMCWEMLTLEQKANYKQLLIDHDVQSVFESPEQHAELILRAKEIS